MRSLFGGSAIVATAIFVGSLTFSPSRLEAETLSLAFNQKVQNAKLDVVSGNKTEGGAIGSFSGGLLNNPAEPAELGAAAAEEFAAAPASFVATAYSLRGKTASGKPVARGLIAADPRVLPLGSKVRLDAGFFSGEYLVADTGGAVRGKRIDIWTPSTREAFRFGRRTIKLTVLSYGPKRARAKAKR
jgi:3D (Asp-Asp-Asp) domain-containing protein